MFKCCSILVYLILCTVSGGRIYSLYSVRLIWACSFSRFRFTMPDGRASCLLFVFEFSWNFLCLYLGGSSPYVILLCDVRYL